MAGPEGARSADRRFERFFDEIDTEAKAYWLGFILADGCVLWNEVTGTYALSIGLQSRDMEHLTTLERDFGGSRTPLIDPRNGTIRLVWYSKHLAKCLIELGITPRKSAMETIPSYPREYERHFWRGVFDGDGCLTIQRKRPETAPEFRFSLAGSVTVLTAFQEWARASAGMFPQRISRAKNSQGVCRTSVFYLSGNRQIAAVTTALYGDCSRMLRRKYEVYLALLEQNARIRPSYRRVYSGDTPVS